MCLVIAEKGKQFTLSVKCIFPVGSRKIEKHGPKGEKKEERF